LVSIVIPAYNAAAFIGETLASALDQTYRNIEIVVVDDGSTDKTSEIVEAAATRDSRVRLLRQPNRGVAAARNLGIEHSQGAFVAPLDADDLWRPDKIARQVATMHRSGPRVGMVYTWSLLIDEASQILPRPGAAWYYYGNVVPYLITHNFVGNGSTPLLRRDCVLEVGGYDRSIRAHGGEGTEDLMLYLKIAEQYQVAFVPAFLVGYRMTPFSMSSNARQMIRGHELVLEVMRARHPELPNRIFRWSRSRTCFLMSGMSLRRRMFIFGVLLLARALAHDPALVLEPPFRRAISKLALRLTRRALTDGAKTAPAKFLETSLYPDAFASSEVPILSPRRIAFLSSLCRGSAREQTNRRERA